jgi:hypothetical protein
MEGKSVFCRNCFKKSDETKPRRPESPYKKPSYHSEQSNGGNAKELAEINAKLDKILAVLGDLELDEEADEEKE